jgi:hypothetical protein
MNPEREVDAAMNLLEEIRRVSRVPSARADIPLVLDRLGFRIGLQFAEGINGKKRRGRRLVGAVVTSGGSLLPCRGLVDQGGHPGGGAVDHGYEPTNDWAPRKGPQANTCETGKGRSNRETAHEVPLGGHFVHKG